MMAPKQDGFNRFLLRIWYASVLRNEGMPIVECPHCGKETEYNDNEFRPFCSDRCKLLDFGAWADEEYNIPSESTALSEEDVDAIERALEEKSK